MTSDRDALLRAICAAPDEDTPRLVYADWLDENGEPERAEYIRIQCELARYEDQTTDSFAMYDFLRTRYAQGLAHTDWARVDPGVGHLIALDRRAGELLAASGGGWEPPPTRAGARWLTFRRGFPDHMAAQNLGPLGSAAERVRAVVPSVTLIGELGADRAAELLDAGLLGWVSGLRFRTDGGPGLAVLGERPEAVAVHTVVANGGDLLPVAEALAGSPHWAGLRHLDLSETWGTEDGAAALFRARHLRGLRTLRLRGYVALWSADTFRLLADGGFDQLRSLHLTHCGLNDDAAERLADCPHLANLRDLNLTHNHLTGRGVTALLCSPHLANLQNLRLDYNPCSRLDAERLASAAPGLLRLLHFHGARLRTADVRALSRCPRLRTLWYLDIDDNDLGMTAVRALARGFGDWCPPILWLAYNRIDNRGAAALAKWPGAANLSALHLKYNQPMTGAGTHALLVSPHLANLNHLTVSDVAEADGWTFRTRFPLADGY